MTNSHGDSGGDIQSIGCFLIFMGIVAASFGIGGMMGIIENLELEFFGIELNTQRGRALWVAGCLATIGFGILLAKIKKKPNKSL